MLYNYHDATFVSATIHWMEGTAVLVFRLGQYTGLENHIIIAGMEDFSCQRNFPWGQSISVNNVTISPTESVIRTVEIEMQSGDKISILGKEVTEEVVNVI